MYFNRYYGSHEAVFCFAPPWMKLSSLRLYRSKYVLNHAQMHKKPERPKICFKSKGKSFGMSTNCSIVPSCSKKRTFIHCSTSQSFSSTTLTGQSINMACFDHGTDLTMLSKLNASPFKFFSSYLRNQSVFLFTFLAFIDSSSFSITHSLLTPPHLSKHLKKKNNQYRTEYILRRTRGLESKTYPAFCFPSARMESKIILKPEMLDYRMTQSVISSYHQNTFYQRPHLWLTRTINIPTTAKPF